MPMGRKQKETVELRFYEIPQGEPVLALLGEEWNRVYGHDNFYLHFHNLMEIGICRKGEGELIINEHTYTYRTNSVTLIPPNIPHTTISNGMVRNSWEFLYVDDLADLCVFLMNNYSGNETVNAGTGKEITIKALAELIASVVGYNGAIHWDTSKPNGTPRKLLDVSKSAALGWQYQTELEEGIRLAYEDFLQNPMRAER